MGAQVGPSTSTVFIRRLRAMVSALTFLVLVSGVAAKRYTSFQPGELWLDTDGNRIRAHSAGLITWNDRTYWYGADGYTSGDGLNKVINVYSSSDLYNWDFHGPAFVFNCSEIPGFKPDWDCYADRPKVLHNEATGQFVLWMKSTPYAAVATSASPLGPFKFVRRFYPNGDHMGDPTAFQDPVSGDGFWIYSIKPDVEPERVIRISRMTPDFLNVTGVIAQISEHLEAPAAFYDQASSTYYTWFSHTSGWKPNAAAAFSASKITDTTWASLGNPTNNETTFSSQSTYVLPYKTKAGKQRFIYIADRFEPYISGSESGRYVWLPIDVNADGTLTVTWHSEWSLDDLEESVVV